MFFVLALFAQASAVSPVDWQGWAQLGFTAGVAVYLLVYDGPRTRDKYEANLREMIKQFKEMMEEERTARKEELHLLRDAFKCRAS